MYGGDCVVPEAVHREPELLVQRRKPNLVVNAEDGKTPARSETSPNPPSVNGLSSVFVPRERTRKSR